MKKKILCMFIAIVMCMVPLFSMAEEDTSQEEEGVIEEPVAEEEIVVPAKVTGVSLSCTRQNDITVKWNAAENAEKYKVYRWNSTKKKYVCIKTTEKLSYVDEGRISGKRYVYKVAAVKGDLIGEKSDKKGIRSYVRKVTGVKVSCKAITNNVKITWNNVPRATGYKVYRWSKKKGKYILIGTTSKRSYTDKAKASKTTYKYKVAAYQKFKADSGKTVVKRGLKSKTKSVKTYGKYRGVSLAKPLKTISVCSSYGWRWGRMHYGTDMRASTGTRVYAAAGGTVIESHGTQNTMGVTIKIRHSNGVTTTYGHLSKRYAYVGDKVKTGECIALAGSTGNAQCSHLHFEVRFNGSTVNPMNFY